MSKFNQTNKGVTKTTNLAGGAAYSLKDKEALMTGILTSFYGENKYYGDNSGQLVQLIRTVGKVDTKFVANLALYARKKMFLRSIAHVIAAELAFISKGSIFVRRTIAEVCERPDDMTEILAYYLSAHGKPIPNSLKKGLADAMLKFDEYQLAKYNRKQTVALKDVLRICHPRPKNKDQEALFGRLKNDELQVPYTWEVELSAKGNSAEVWQELIASKKVGYMATLRNLRNIAQSGASNAQEAYNYIANPVAVKNSKQIPFRFFSAYRELQSVLSSRALEAVQRAMEISVDNLLTLPGKTLVVTDTSGSMDSRLSERGTVSYNDVGALMCATAHKFCEDAILGVFGTNFATVNVSKLDTILTNVDKIKRVDVGWSTNMWKVFEWMKQSNIKFDRVIIFSDMQAYSSSLYYTDYTPQKFVDEYRAKVNPNLWVHSIDLAGHGTSQFSQHNRLNLMAGWNTNILEYMVYAEAGIGKMINDVEGYYFK